MVKALFLGVSLALLPMAVGAQDQNHGHGHAHAAPHGGTLVVLGDHGGHLELVLDPKEGRLTGYVLDAHAENPVRIAQESITLKIAGRGKERSTSFTLTLAAVGSELTGEKKGDTSEFSGKAGQLKKLKRFQGLLSDVNLRGQKFKRVSFNFPEGNE